MIVTLVTLSGFVAPSVASAQDQSTDSTPSSSSVASEEPPGTTVPEGTTTTTEPEEPSDTTEPEDPTDGSDSGDVTEPEDPTAQGAEGSGDDNSADALTWAAIGITLLLLGVVVGWMLRRPARTAGPPSDDDWPSHGELL